MLVTQSIETNVNILANSPMMENISSVLKSMPFDHHHCRDAVDSFMIPCFLLFLDGNMLNKDNSDIDTWECCINSWTGKMKKCIKCRNYLTCLNESSAEIMDEYVWPEYNPPVIMLHADKRQRNVESLMALIPPMPVNDPFSLELENWIISKCLLWHKKALQWRKQFEQWKSVMSQKDSCKKKTFSELAEQRWIPKTMTLELRSPEYE